MLADLSGLLITRFCSLSAAIADRESLILKKLPE